MTEPEQQPETKRKWTAGRIVRALIWTLLGVAVFGFVSIWILSSIGGKSEPLKQGLEQSLSQFSKSHAQIGELNNLSLYPLVEVDFSNLSLRRTAEGDPWLTLDHMVISMRFWDVFFSRRLFVNFDLQGLSVALGHIGPGALVVKKASIENVEGSPAQLKAGGVYNEKPFNAQMELEKRPNAAYGNLFSLRQDGQLNVEIGDLFLNARHESFSGFTKGYQLTSLSAGVNGNEALSGEVTVRNRKHETLLTGSLKIAESQIIPDIRFGQKDAPEKIAGEVRLPVLSLGGSGTEARFGEFFTAFQKTFLEGPQETAGTPISESWEGLDLDLTFKLEDIRAGAEKIGTVTLPVKLANQMLRIEPAGTISGGTVAGQLTIDAQESPAALKGEFALKNWDFGQIQKGLAGIENIAGHADIVVSLTAKGAGWPELVQSLDGEAALIAGKGKLASGMLEFWGGGVISAMLPSMDPETRLDMNCAIADFRIQEGVASAQTLFLDTNAVMVQGEGTVDLPDSRIDIKLVPESKGLAIGDIAVPVVITGSIADPSIGPSVLGLGAKLGGLLLGTVNPAFLAFSLTDLGLTEEHPCYGYLQGQPAPENLPDESSQ